MNALSCQQVEAFLANETSVVLPIVAVLKLANAVNQIVVALAHRANSVARLKTSLNSAGSTLEFIVRETLNAGSSVGLHASILHFLATVGVGDEEPALTGVASVIVVGFASRNDALVVLQLERFEAFETSVVVLLDFAAQKDVVSALSENQRVFVVAFLALPFVVVVFAVFNTVNAGSFLKSVAVCAVGAGLTLEGEAADEGSSDLGTLDVQGASSVSLFVT